MFYLGNFFLMSFFSVFASRENEKTILYILIFYLTMMIGLRNEVGCDWPAYLEMFEKSSDLFGDLDLGIYGFLLQREVGFYEINNLFRSLDLEIWAVNILFTLIFLVGLTKIALTQSRPLLVISLCFPVLILNMTMSGIRQSVAIGLICFAYYYFLRKEVRWFVFYVILAALFHTSAIIFLAMGFYIKRRGILPTLVILVVVLAMIFLIDIYTLQHTKGYVGDEKSEAFGFISRGAVYLISPAIYFLFLRRRLDRNSQEMVLFDIVSILTILFFVGGFVSSVIGDRFQYYLIPVQVIILVRSLVCFQQKQLTVFLYSAVYGAYFLIWTSLSSNFRDCYLPYNNFMWS